MGEPVDRAWIPYVLIALLTAGSFSCVVNHDFVWWDDDIHLTENHHVNTGLTAQNVRWAWTSIEFGNWLPLTWMSHQLDYQLFGDDAGKHHITSLAIHICNALLLLHVLRLMTGSLWRSALVAMLFALHPLRVESVAWLSERKDVLSTLFAFAAIWMYARYVQKPSVTRYAPVLILFALSLMSKPMYVTLPFALLLLDVWPLGRLSKTGRGGRLGAVYEKLPLFAMTIAASIVTYIAQKQSHAVVAVDDLPILDRLANAFVAVACYLGKTIWPANLSHFYPLPDQGWPSGAVVLAVILFFTITVVAVAQFRKRPYGLIGWLWLVGMLVPVIGLVKAGAQAMADRFTYAPLVGVFIFVAWSLPARALKPVFVVCGLVLGVLTFHQANLWRDSVTLFSHAIEIDPNSAHAHSHLATAYQVLDRNEDAKRHLLRAIDLKPGWSLPYKTMAMLLEEEGDTAGATRYARRGAGGAGPAAGGHYVLAELLVKQGDIEGAIAEIRAAIADQPKMYKAHNMLGNLLTQRKRYDEAIAAYREAIALYSNQPDQHYNLGRAQILAKRHLQAAASLRRAIELDKNHGEAHHHLGLALESLGQHDKALSALQTATGLLPGNAAVQANLALTLSRLDRLREADTAMTRASTIDPTNFSYLLALGGIKEKLEKPYEALQLYRRALKRNTNSARTHNAIGMLMAKSGNMKAAVRHFDKAVKIEPNNVNARKNLAQARRMLNE